MATWVSSICMRTRSSCPVDGSDNPGDTHLVNRVAAVKSPSTALVAVIATARDSSGRHEERDGEEKSRETSKHVKRGGRLLCR